MRHRSLRTPPITFAHRGASAHAAENTLAAFELAVRLGATGLESDVWRTRDGEPVLDHDGLVRRGIRRRPIAELRRAELPGHIPTLGELYDRVGTDLDISVDVRDTEVLDAVFATAANAGGDALARLWLCHPDHDVVTTWRARQPDVRLVDSTRMRRIGEGLEQRARRLADAGVDALNLHWSDWTPGHVATLHRFGRYAFGWDAQHDRSLEALLAAGIDALYSDHVDRMVSAVERCG